jgi:hypothetical protein
MAMHEHKFLSQMLPTEAEGLEKLVAAIGAG